MTSFTFSLEQLRSAPPEVRRWIENEIAAALASLTRSEHEAFEPHSVELAACTPEEALRVFGLIKGNFLLSQVFFELAREMPPLTGGSGPFHALNIAEILRHARLSDGDRLADCLTAINTAFQSVRSDEEAALVGSIKVAGFTSTRRRIRASAGCGSSSSRPMSPVPAARPRLAMARRRRSASRCPISAQARTSRNIMCRVPEPPLSDLVKRVVRGWGGPAA
jgi:hypothetical protein